MSGVLYRSLLRRCVISRLPGLRLDRPAYVRHFCASSRPLKLCPCRGSCHGHCRGSPSVVSVRRISTSTPVCAKGKDKKKDKKKSSKIDESLMSEVISVGDLRNDLQKVVDGLRTTYMTNFAVRTAVGSLETIQVPFDGDNYPLNELAQVVRKSPSLMVVNSSAFPQATADIVRVIQSSGLGLNPQQEGTTIYVQLPKVTREHRENLAKGAKAVFIKARDALKDVQNRQIRAIKNVEHVSDDTLFSVKEQITLLTDDYITSAEDLHRSKTSELLG